VGAVVGAAHGEPRRVVVVLRPQVELELARAGLVGPVVLQAARATIERNTMAAAYGLTLREPPALLHFAKRLDVVVWKPERIT